MNAYEEKIQARVERLEERAEKARNESNESFKRSHELTENIPFGQPILVGHHSERRHRKTLEKSWNAMGKSVALDKKADELERRAESVASSQVISADDPEAIEKLKAQLANEELSRDTMKAANVIIRGKPRDEWNEEKHAKLIEIGIPGTDDEIKKLFEKGHCTRNGFASYVFSNIGANIKRIKERISKLESIRNNPTSEKMIGDVRIERNIEDNRIRLFYPDKPSDEIRQALKRGGYRWSNRFKAWQAFLGGMAEKRADRMAALWEGSAA